MPLEPPQDLAAPLVSRPHRAPAPLVLAGVAGACLLGAGLGLWARPSDLERPFVHRPRTSRPVQAPAAAPPRIEIRVNGASGPPPALVARAAPVTAPPAPAAAPVQPTPPPELLAPKPAPEGLMRVRAVAPPQLAQAPRATPRLPSTADLAARAAKERGAHAAAAQKAARRVEAERQARAEAEAVARKARLEKVRLAAAAEAKAREKAALTLAAKKAAEHRAAAQAVAAAEARKTRLAEQKAEKTAQARAARLADDRRKAEAKAAAQRSTSQVRVAGARPRCASPDPGAALACTDPALSAAERQLTRAYRQAQAAGVPEERLQRQQQRWLAARANAARQAPWAVHDIYLARIAELQDQTRVAAEGD